MHANTPDGWYVGRPMEHRERGQWAMFAFDPSETPVEGRRAREWTTVAPTDLEVVRSMAYRLRELKAGTRAGVAGADDEQRPVPRGTGLR